MGLNTGEAQERDGDYFGPPVNRAGSPDGGWPRRPGAAVGGDCGARARRDVAQPRRAPSARLRAVRWSICQLGTEEFPPLRTLDELPGNLPMQRTSFVGRVDEVKELAALVTTERIVTLTGAGGVGKSRLALQVAAEVAPDFADGTWFVSLAALDEGALVAATILDALGVPERRGDRRSTPCAGGRRTARRCWWSTTASTCSTRGRRRSSTASPRSSTDCTIARDQSGAPRRARRARLGGQPVVATGAAWRATASSCSSTGPGMARADFELTRRQRGGGGRDLRAARPHPARDRAGRRARARHDPADIARRLDQRLRLLASTDRLAPGRHRTLDAAVRWSYELLDDTQQRVFDRLSVVRRAVHDRRGRSGRRRRRRRRMGRARRDARAGRQVARRSPTKTTGATRYRLLETMRQFGSANLAAAETTRPTATPRRLLRRLRACRAVRELHGAGDQAALDEITRSFENIRVTLRHAAEDLDSARFEEMFICLFPLWHGRGRTLEGLAWCGEALRERPVIDPRTSSSRSASARSSQMPATSTSPKRWSLPPKPSRSQPARRCHSRPSRFRSLRALMQGRSDDAIAEAERLIALAPDEPDIFVRLQSLENVLACLAIAGDLDRFAGYEEISIRLWTSSAAGSSSQATRAQQMPVAHLVDSDHRRSSAVARLRTGNHQFGNLQANCSHACFSRSTTFGSATMTPLPRWTRRSLQLAIDHAPAYVAQVINTATAVTKYRSPTDAACYLVRSARTLATGSQLGPSPKSMPRPATKHRYADHSATSSKPSSPKVPRSTTPA